MVKRFARPLGILAASSAVGIFLAWGGMWCVLAFGPEALLDWGAVT